MGDKKKHKDKKKNKKKNKDKEYSREKKNKKRSSSSESSSESRSRSRNKKASKSKKKQKKESSKEIIRNPQPQDTSFLMNYNAPRQSSGFVLPVTRNMPPPPVAQAASTAPVPKTKSKQINLFKLMPKLPYGPLTLARTVFCSDLIDPQIYHKELKQMCSQMQKTAKSENYKKAASNMTKCINELEKIQQHRKNKESQVSPLTDNTQNRYKQLDRILQKHLEELQRQSQINQKPMLVQ